MVKFNTCDVCGNAWISGSLDIEPTKCNQCDGQKRPRGPVKSAVHVETAKPLKPLQRGPIVKPLQPLRRFPITITSTSHTNEETLPLIPEKKARGPAKVGRTVVNLSQSHPRVVEAIKTQPLKSADRPAQVNTGLITNYLRNMETERPVISGGRSLIVKALAGTGKTTTCDEGLWRLNGEKKLKGSEQQEAIWDWMLSGERPKSIAITSMGKAITEVLKKRVGNRAYCSTIHGMGLKACISAFRIDPKTQLTKWRTEKLLEEYHKEDLRTLRKRQAVYCNFVVALTNLAKLTLCGDDHESLEKLARTYTLDVPDGSFASPYDTVGWLLHRSQDQIESIDYNDMLWLPVVKNVPLTAYNLMMVDEGQDLNRVQQEFVLRSCRRMMLVGDPHQAIYGFAGADTLSMNRMRSLLEERGDAIELPLTVTRRCGKVIVEEAKKIVPEFEAHESNSLGEIKRSVDQEVMDSRSGVQDGDMVLCRLNGPLVSLVFKYIKQERKATIQGRDIGQGLLNFINDTLKASTVTELNTKLSEYYSRQYKEITNRKYQDESALIALSDKTECIRSLSDGAKSIRDIEERITAIFKDDEKNGILLSSIHKAKGLEAKRVWIREPRLMPYPCKSEWQMKQEYNLKYVAITRAIDQLNFAKDTPRRKTDDDYQGE
jgi:DNA helicase II / ATP-dependent DNA helicase PcrA